MEEKLSFLVSWYFESESKFSCSIIISRNNQSSVSHMRRTCPLFSNWRTWRMVQKD